MDVSSESKVDWRELCRQATEEKDPHRLIEIVDQLIAALDEPSRKSVE